MVRYAVGYRSRAFVTFGRADSARRLRRASRAASVLELAHLRAARDRPALQGAADGARWRRRCGRRSPRADLERPHHGHARHAAARPAPTWACTSGDEVAGRGHRAARDPRHHRRRAAAASACASATCCATTAAASSTCWRTPARRTDGAQALADDRRRLEGPLPLARRRSTCLAAPGLALRHAPGRLRAAVHRRRDGRRGDRRRRRPAGPRPPPDARLPRRERGQLRRGPAPPRASTSASSTPSSASGIERNISLKLTQLGLDVDRATAVDNLRRILEPADQHGFFVRIDMENSPYTDRTLEVFETLWQQGHRSVGVVLQSCLTRSPRDVRAPERAGRARPAGQGRLQGTEDRRVPGQGRGRRGVRRADARAARPRARTPPSPRTIRR